MTIRFKAELRDGTILTGPIGGAGGMLGAGVPDHRAVKYALARIRSLQNIRPYESVKIYPDYSAKGDGEPVAVPLLVTDFSIQGAKR